MPRRSATDNVKKICGCAKWKSCTHAWYLDFRQDNVRYRDNLDKLTGRHAIDFAHAKEEARRAIVAKLEGRDPRELIPDDDPTLGQLLTLYLREKPRKDSKQALWQVGKIVATELHALDGLRPFGEWRISAITTDTVKEFRRQRPAVAGNRDLALLRAAFNLAVLQELVPRSPFRVGDVSAVRLSREEGRTRRLQGDEEQRLLEVCLAGKDSRGQARAGNPHLRAIIVAAIESGCRIGELLSLQWHQVRFAPRAELFLPAQKTKAKKDRRVPISSALKSVLEARRHDPAGDLLPPEAFVFGDELGRPRRSVKSAWRFGCQRAKISDLHVHDLRREAGSRWMDAGVPLATIQRWLGHHNISQTSTYLGASTGGDEQDMRAYEAKIGRADPLTQIDLFDHQEVPNATTTAPRTPEIPEQNHVVPGPVGTIH